MRLVHREILWSLAASLGVTAALAGWALDPPTNHLAAVLAWGGFALGLLGTACAYTLYGRRTAPDRDHWIYHNPNTPTGACTIEQCTYNGPIACALPAGHPYGHVAAPGRLRPHAHHNLMDYLHHENAPRCRQETGHEAP